MNKIIEFNILPLASLNVPINQLLINLVIGSVNPIDKNKRLKLHGIETLFLFL